MAGGARTCSAAIGVDVRHALLDGVFHGGLADGNVDHVFLAAVLDVGDFRHLHPSSHAAARISFIGMLGLASISAGGLRPFSISFLQAIYSAGLLTASTAINLSP